MLVMLAPSTKSMVVICKNQEEAQRLALDLDFGVPRLFIIRSVYPNSVPDWHLRQDFTLFVGDDADLQDFDSILARMVLCYTNSWLVVVAKGNLTLSEYDAACEHAESAGEHSSAHVYAGVRDHWVTHGFETLTEFLSGLGSAKAFSDALSGNTVDDITLVDMISDLYSMYDVGIHGSCGLPQINDPLISAVLSKVKTYAKGELPPKTLLASNLTKEDLAHLRTTIHPAGRVIVFNATGLTLDESVDRCFKTLSNNQILILTALNQRA